MLDGRVTHLADLMHRAEASNGSAIASNWILSTDGTKRVCWRPESAGGGGSVSYASNATDVSSVSAGGSMTEVTRADHVHRGVHSILSNGSNARFGDVIIQAGPGVVLSVSGNTITVSADLSGSHTHPQYLEVD